MADGQTPDEALATADPAEVAKMVSQVSDEQLAEGMASDNRKTVLDEIFRRMTEAIDPQAAGGTEAVVHWKILDRPGGGYDHYEVVIDKGACSVSEQPSREPRITFKIPAVEFLRLVTGGASGPGLFMTGKLRIEGDLMLAATMAGMFQVPGAPPG